MQKRGKDFWNEFELYLSDLLVGVVLDAALVGLLAPYVQFGARPSGKGVVGALSRAIQALPSRSALHSSRIRFVSGQGLPGKAILLCSETSLLLPMLG